VLVGLSSMGIAILGFAFAGGFWTLFAARLFQGAGSGFTWAGAFAWLLAATPRERRGEMLGTAMGSATFGAMLGPVVGAAAALAGREAVFATLAALAVVLIAWTLRLEPAPCEAIAFDAITRALRNGTFVTGMFLMTLGALLFGILAVLAPLHLAAAGWGAAAIGAVWLAGAALETVQAPLAGRMSDRRGPYLPTQIALVGATVLSLGLATDARPLAYAPLLVVSALFFGVFFTTAFALLANGAEEAGLPQGMAFGLMNVAWALGAVSGPAAGGAIAAATGDWIPFVLGAAVCSGTFVVLQRRMGGRRIQAKLGVPGA
jgi:MFS family permease